MHVGDHISCQMMTVAILTLLTRGHSIVLLSMHCAQNAI